MPEFLPRMSAPLTDRDAALLSPLVLAFVGDGVQTLFERTRAALTLDKKPHELHLTVSKAVNATAQATAFLRVEALLTEAETAVFHRGRNAKSGTSAKNASIVDYRVATGFEALVGYLYLSGQIDRLDAILSAAYPAAQTFQNQ